MLLLESMQARQEVEEVKKKLEFLWTQVQIADMGVRGYLLIPEDLMAVPLHEAAGRYTKGFEELEEQLSRQGFNISEVDSFKKRYLAKMQEALQMKDLKRDGKGEEALEILKKDSGYQLWLTFTPLQDKILAFEKGIKDKADARYEQSLANTLIIQVVLLVLSIPVLLLVVYQLLRNEWQKKALFNQVRESNSRYLFCENLAQEKVNEEKVIAYLIANLQKASGFIQEIAKGNYGVQWQGLNEQNERLNSDTLSGHLLNMREQMKKVKEEEQRRLWATEGFAKFSDLLRLHNDNLETAVFVFLSELIKYIKANQGAVFVTTETQEGEAILEMKACYAYGKKKFIKQRVHSGEGLVGQAFQEKDKIYLTDVPANYIKISSGLGEELPRCILIVPLKNNEQVVGVLELACFQTLADYQVEFVEKVAENISGYLVTAQVNARTKSLLQESLQTAEQMRSQEEEMRQNMEELEATQEEMRRNEQAHLQEISRLEGEYYNNMVALQKQELEMKGYSSAVDTTLATVEFDLAGKIITANERFLTVMGYSLDEIQGKHHRLFVKETDRQSKAYTLFWQELACGKEQIGEVRRIAKNGQEIWLTASYTPILDEEERVVKIIKFAQDITKEKQQALDYQSQLEAISNSSSVIEFNLDSTIIAANENFLRLMNYQASEVIGKRHRLFVTPSEQESEEYTQLWDKLRAGEYVDGEFERIANRGKRIWIKGSYNPIKDINGKVYKIVKYAGNITEQKLLELQTLQQTEELRAQEEEIRQNLEELQATQDEMERKALELQAQIAAVDASLATIEFDLQGNILKANKNFLAVMGYEMEELIHQPHGIFVEKSYRDSNDYSKFWQQLREGKTHIGKVKRLTKEGKGLWLNASYTPVFDEKAQLVKIIKLAQVIDY
jgi:PAS domain S-box-containing protein